MESEASALGSIRRLLFAGMRRMTGFEFGNERKNRQGSLCACSQLAKVANEEGSVSSLVWIWEVLVTNMNTKLRGERFEIALGDKLFPPQLSVIPKPPDMLYGIGNPDALVPGLAIIGARKATPYGIGCARRFARIAAEKGVVIISGGARGCDSEAHKAAVEVGGQTVVVLGGGCDKPYPAEHLGMFQRVIDTGGAILSENPWETPPLPFMFRLRNRIIAGLSNAVLIVEAGLPSGTFSTADEALDVGRDVLVVPGSITSETSLGANRLLLQGAMPVVDDESFEEALFRACGALMRPGEMQALAQEVHPLIAAAQAEPMSMESLRELAVGYFGEERAYAKLMELLVEAESCGHIARRPDGRWGPIVPWA